MDSNSLAVVLTPNIFSSQETKKGKKNAKGGCGVGPGDIKSMTSKFMKTFNTHFITKSNPCYY